MQPVKEKRRQPPPSKQELLLAAASKLNEIVEGVTSERWQNERGQRLKDTTEWAEFYCALAAFRRT